jgi:hypothetical protein
MTESLGGAACEAVNSARQKDLVQEEDDDG